MKKIVETRFKLGVSKRDQGYDNQIKILVFQTWGTSLKNKDSTIKHEKGPITKGTNLRSKKHVKEFEKNLHFFG
jgi:hypothetical protein